MELQIVLQGISLKEFFVRNVMIRSTLWGETLTTKNCSTLERHIENKQLDILTFGKNYFLGLQRQLIHRSFISCVMKDAGLLTGCSSRRHVRVCAKLDLPSSSTTKKFKLEGVDW